MTEAELQERERALAPRLTPEFLETLREAVRVVGWSVDAVESISFVEKVHEMAGVKVKPDEVEPYQTE
jgi:hypothetical protein